MHESDDAAVAEARNGDREAFRTLVERHSRYLFRIAYRLTRNTEDAQDVVQDTWLKAHAQLGRFESRANVRTWLTRIAINCAIDHLRVAVVASRLTTRPRSIRSQRADGSKRPTRSRTAWSSRARSVRASIRR